VIVLHEHDGLLDGLHLLQQRLREALVHQRYTPVGGAKARALVDDVAERPQALIGEAVVIAGLLLVAQPHAPQRVRRVRRGQPDPLADLTVGVAAAVGDPHAADACMIGPSAVTRPLAGSCSRTRRPSRTWLTGSRWTRRRRAAAEAHLDELLETLLRPHALAGQPQPRLPLGGAAGAREVRPGRDLGGERAEELSSASGGGATGRRLHLLGPLRDPCDRRVTDQRTSAHVMPVTSSIRTPMRTAVRRHRSTRRVEILRVEEDGGGRPRAPPAAPAPRTPTSATATL